MLKGGDDCEIRIKLSETSKKYSKEFLEKLNNERVRIIADIVLRLANENKI